MLKRFIAFFVSFCLVIGFVCSSFVTFAVAPVALVEAALVSYVASTGYKLWVDNGTGSDVLSLMSDLYSDWLFSLSGGTLTLEQIGDQNLVYNDNSGHICITKTAADIFQSFADWLQLNYSVPTDGTHVTVVSGAQKYTNPSGAVAYRFDCISPYDGNYISTLPYAAYINGSVTGSVFGVAKYSSSFLIGCYDGQFYKAHITNSGQLGSFRGRALSSDGTYIAGLGFSSSSNLFSFAGAGSADSHFFPIYDTSPVPLSNLDSSSFTAFGSSGGLAVSLAQNVIDKASDLAQDYVLVFDVGAAAGATAADIADAVVSGYDSLTGVIPVTDTVTAADVIDTPVQPYPDVDSLGLPQLGLALTTRFPFSIPWDISAIYSAISAPSEPPVKTFDLIPASVLARWGINANTSITIDLTEQKYSVLLAIIHWSCIIGFCFGLAVMTKRYVWTTGG